MEARAPAEAAGCTGTSGPAGSGPRPTAARAAANRLRGAAVLAALALLGLGLSALGRVEGPRAQVAVLQNDAGDTIVLVVSGTGRRALFGTAEVRLVLSRLPLSLEPERSVVRFEGGVERVLPPGWPTVLIERSGRIERLDGEIAPARAQALFRESSFEGARRALIAWDPRLEKFFLD